MSTLFDDSVTPAIDPAKDYSVELVGDGKPFKDIPALARAKVESDAFIKQLTNETKALREELAKRATLEEVVTKISQNKQVEQPPVITPGQAHQPENLTKEQLEALIADNVSKRVAEKETELEAKKNFDHVISELQKSWGAGFREKLESKAKELGLGREWLTQLAGQKPQAFLTLVGVQAAPAPQSLSPFDVSGGGVNSAALSATSHRGEKTKSYYDNMKLTNRDKYLSKENQQEMYHQAMKLGEKFFDA